MEPETPFGEALYRARSNSRLGVALRQEGVKRSQEFVRIHNIPSRELDGSIDVEGLSALLRLPDDDPTRCKGCSICDRGRMTLFPDQAYTIKECYDSGGVVCGADVGSGKSLAMLLCAYVVHAKRALFLMPASARPGFEEDQIPLMRRHWRMPQNIMIGSYESMGTQNGKDFLTARMPDWIFADEAHYFKDPKNAARSRRFMRFFDDFPSTRLGVFSGSFFDRTVIAFAHLFALCLRENVPLPYKRQHEYDDKGVRTSSHNVHAEELSTWASCIDANVPDSERYSIGALEAWVPEKSKHLTGWERALAAFGARLVSVPGVVFSSVTPTTTAIHIREQPIEIPPRIKDAFEVLRETNQTPAGETFGDATELYRLVRQLGQGFFYRWVWPKGPDGKEVRDLVWIQARQNWNRKVRNVIAHARGKYDSKGEVENAARNFEAWNEARTFKDKVTLTRLDDVPKLDSQEWRNWKSVEKNYTPVTEVTWIDHFLVNRVCEWLDEAPGIAWVESKAFGEAIRKKGFRYYRGGENEIRYETASCAAAIKAHKEAKNLQQFSRNWIVTPPSRGKDWQQMIGRTDRSGQRAKVIDVCLTLHVREFWTSFYKARQDAAFAAAPGLTQKLLRADTSLLLDDEGFITKSFGEDPLWKFNRRA